MIEWDVFNVVLKCVLKFYDMLVVKYRVSEVTQMCLA